MSGHTGKLTRLQEKAISALLQNSTIVNAAKATGIGESTIRRWKKDFAFAKALADAQRAVVADTVRMVQRSSGAALAALLTIMSNATASSTARVMAAKAVLEIAIRERPASPGVQLQATNSASDIAVALAVVTNAVASGELNPEEGRALAVLLEGQRKAIETTVLEKRLADLEQGSFEPPSGIEWDRPYEAEELDKAA